MKKYLGKNTVNAKGGVVIPAKVRKTQKINKGDEIAFVEDEEGNIIIKRYEPGFKEL